MNREPFEIGEWYHCFNRGVDKREVFLDEADYERFLILLYLGNDRGRSINLRDSYKGFTFGEILQTPQEEPFVDVGAYCLMPNHFHLLLREKIVGGISMFMRKIATSYTMYFNLKNERTGSLFSGAFKSKHVVDDRYFKRVLNYIHANAAELIEPQWKAGIINNRVRTCAFLRNYRYSSLPDCIGTQRAESAIINRPLIEELYEAGLPSIDDIFTDALAFAQKEPKPKAPKVKPL